MKQITEFDIKASVDQCDKQIRELKNDKLYLMACLGQKFLENNTEKTVIGTPYEEIVREIFRINQQIVFYKKCKSVIQGEWKYEQCKQCGAIMRLEGVFCNSCGKRLEPLFEEKIEN